MAEHHPSDVTRLGYARSELGAGAALLVASHLERCPQCVADLEAESHGRYRADSVVSGAAREASAQPPGPTEAARSFPRPLAKLRYGKWRWAGPGAKSAAVEGAAGLGEHVYLLKAGAGQKLARHGHPGSELVLVLKGAFRDGQTLYSVDDVSERHQRDVHALQVSGDGECICLVVNDGPPELFGVARWLRPVLRL